MNKKNLANAELLNSISDSQTTIEVKQGQGANFPQTPFHITATPLGVLSAIDNSEIMKVTDVNVDTLTVERGQRGSSQHPFSGGSLIVNGIYVEDINSLEDSLNTKQDSLEEITEAEITAGTASTARSMSGRRAQAIVSKSQANLSPAIQLNANKTAVGINKVPEQGVLDVEGDIYSNGEKVVPIYYQAITVNNTHNYTAWGSLYYRDASGSNWDVPFTKLHGYSVENTSVNNHQSWLGTLNVSTTGVNGTIREYRTSSTNTASNFVIRAWGEL